MGPWEGGVCVQGGSAAVGPPTSKPKKSLQALLIHQLRTESRVDPIPALTHSANAYQRPTMDQAARMRKGNERPRPYLPGHLVSFSWVSFFLRRPGSKRKSKPCPVSRPACAYSLAVWTVVPGHFLTPQSDRSLQYRSHGSLRPTSLPALVPDWDGSGYTWQERRQASRLLINRACLGVWSHCSHLTWPGMTLSINV